MMGLGRDGEQQLPVALSWERGPWWQGWDVGPAQHGAEGALPGSPQALGCWQDGRCTAQFPEELRHAPDEHPAQQVEQVHEQ